MIFYGSFHMERLVGLACSNLPDTRPLNPKPIYLNRRSRLKSWTSRWPIFARFLRLRFRIS